LGVFFFIFAKMFIGLKVYFQNPRERKKLWKIIFLILSSSFPIGKLIENCSFFVFKSS